MQRQPLEIQTLYAELLEQLSALEARRSIGHLSGSFITKTVKGERYCYFQHSEPGGKKRQLYIGRKDSVLDKVVARYREERENLAEDTAGIERLCALLRAGGIMETDTASARVLKALSDSGLFHLGGVLVGTHAFVLTGNLLGVRWTGASLRTQDIDIAAEPKVRITLPKLKGGIPRVLEGLEMGFLPVPQLDPEKPSTSFKVRGKGLRVDLLTPRRGQRVSGPVAIPRLEAAAQPLPFLDFLIENPVRGAVVNGGGVLVSVPAPARFAFHKLILAEERDAATHGKREKDLRQAAQVLSLLVEERPGDLRIAWDEIRNRGAGWVKRLNAGMMSMGKLDPAVGKKLAALLKGSG